MDNPTVPAKRKRLELNIEMKKAVCTYKKNHPQASREKIADVLQKQFNLESAPARATISNILQEEEKWLNMENDRLFRHNPVKHPELDKALLLWNNDKAQYRKLLVQKWLEDLETEDKVNVTTLKDAVYFTKLAWDKVTSTTVRNCWLHTKIVVDENELEPVPIFPEAIEELGKLLEQYCVVTEVEVLTAPEYAALDKQVATGEILTDEDVLQLVARGNEAENDDSDDSDIEAIGLDPPKISVADAIRGLETALSFMEQEKAENGDDLVATKNMRTLTERHKLIFRVFFHLLPIFLWQNISFVCGEAQLLAQSVTTYEEKDPPNVYQTTLLGVSMLSFRELVRQRKVGNTVDQCPCVVLAGTGRCITYDARFQAANLEEAMLTFVDNSIDPRIYDQSIGGVPISPATFDCISEECKYCVGILTVRLRQVGLLQANGAPNFAFPIPGEDVLRRNSVICSRLRLNMNIPRKNVPDPIDSVSDLINGAAGERLRLENLPKSQFGMDVQQVSGIMPKTHNNGPNRQELHLCQDHLGPYKEDLAILAAILTEISKTITGSHSGSHFGNRHRLYQLDKILLQQSVDVHLNLLSNHLDRGKGHGERNSQSQHHFHLSNRHSLLHNNRSNWENQNFPTWNAANNNAQLNAGGNTQSGGNLPSGGNILSGGNVQSGLGDNAGLGSSLQGNLVYPGLQAAQQIAPNVASSFTNSQFNPNSGSGGAFGSQGSVFGTQNGNGGGGGNGNPPGGIAQQLGTQQSFGQGAFTGGLPWPTQRVKRQSPSDAIIGNRFVINCVERGDAEGENSEFLNLCTACWTWRQLPEDYFPRLINELVCQENDYCLSGWGTCKQRFRNVDVLRRVGSEWRPTIVQTASCCDCKVKAGNQIHPLVVGKNQG
ncbi:hypothetical protein DdX_05879 [Ditylenchus destructor]|uniref:Uncharacterized protein n=1 Tax=Ditylenchus destructor TaxID=166010 RepID=A0AAD4N675_9BILA|nr:hypothetical protein DdX_05879 [Ditylenchus destructor]